MSPRKPAAKKAAVARKPAAKPTRAPKPKPAAKPKPAVKPKPAAQSKPKPAAQSKSKSAAKSRSQLRARPPRGPAPAPAPGVEPGAVLAVPLDDGRWTACQVVGVTDGRPCVAGLRWIGDAAPTLDDLRGAPVLRVDHHAWQGAIDWTHVDAAPPPASLRPLGALPVPELGRCNAYGSWGGVGRQIELQAQWDALPEATRRAYKATPMGPGTELELDLGPARVSVRAAASEVQVRDGDLPVRWAELDRLHRLTSISYAGTDAQVLAHLRDRPLIRKLSWSAHGRDAIDLRDTHLTEVGVEVLAPLTLTLPRTVRELRVSGDVRLLTVAHPGEGAGLALTVGPGPNGATPLPARGLPALSALRVVNAAAVEVTALAAHPALTRLYLHGDAVRVPDVEALAALRALRVLELIHCYGLDAARVPVAAQAWPALERAVVDGYRKPDAARWKQVLAGVASVELRGGKTDAWLAANLDNPFRDWVDRSPSVGKRAAAAWRAARTAIGDGVGRREAERALRALVDAFNRIDAKDGLDTVDREEIGEAFFALAALAGVDVATAEAWFDRWREF